MAERRNTLQPTAPGSRVFLVNPRGTRNTFDVATGLQTLNDSLRRGSENLQGAIDAKKENIKQLVEREFEKDDAIEAADIVANNPGLAGYSKYVGRLVHNRRGHKWGAEAAAAARERLAQPDAREWDVTQVSAFLDQFRTDELARLGITDADAQDGFLATYGSQAESLRTSQVEKRAALLTEEAVNSLGGAVEAAYALTKDNDRWDIFAAHVTEAAADQRFVGLGGTADATVVEAALGLARTNPEDAPGFLRSLLPGIEDVTAKRQLRAGIASALVTKAAAISRDHEANEKATERRRDAFIDNVALPLISAVQRGEAPRSRLAELQQQAVDQGLGREAQDQIDAAISKVGSIVTEATRASDEDFAVIGQMAMTDGLTSTDILNLQTAGLISPGQAEKLQGMRVGATDLLARVSPVKQELNALLSGTVTNGNFDVSAFAPSVRAAALHQFNDTILDLARENPELFTDEDKLLRVAQTVAKAVSEGAEAKTPNLGKVADAATVRTVDENMRRHVVNRLKAQGLRLRLAEARRAIERSNHPMYAPNGYVPDPALTRFWQTEVDRLRLEDE